ncbi:MAG: type IV secretory system conjugative DNA transfer family protein [Candidatus Obscuribacterales bacterium]|nr:type IV secretory system conjugative DNA transfer family protein [Candidatus Obscuribacterales bacterium]
MPIQKPITATHENQVVPVPISDIREFVSNVLGTLDWRDIKTPRSFKKITATQRETTKGISTFDFNFTLTITYKAHGDHHCLLSYEISETKIRILKYCKDRITELVAAIDKNANDWIETRNEQQPSELHGSAQFAEDEELEERDYLTNGTPANRLLLAPHGKAYLTVPPEYTNMHAIVCGPTGAGKSTGFFIPNLIYRTSTSVIVTEATAGDEIPELFALTSGWRQFKRNKVYFFNPGYARGTRINPLDKLKHVAKTDFAAVADELANLVIINTTPPSSTRSDPIWDKSEKHLLWIMIMHVACSEDRSIAHFGAIREILRKNEKSIQATLKSSKSEIAREEFDSFLHHSSENFRHGVFAGLLQRLNPWLSDVIQTMTQTSDLDTSKLQHEKFSFYLSVPSRKQHLKPIAALIFNFLLDLALEKHFDFPPALLLDEFTNYGAIPAIDDALSLIRKRKLPVVLGFQAQSQLTKVYGKETSDNIIGNIGTCVFFRPARPDQAKLLSDALGFRTIVTKETDDRGNTHYREIGKPLMTSQDIQNLPPDEVIITTKSTHPIKIKRFDHQNCPPPNGFDPPEFPEHKLLHVDRLNDSQLQVAAKSAKAKAEQEMDFESMTGELDSIIHGAVKKHVEPSTRESSFTPRPKRTDLGPRRETKRPEPEPEPEPKPKPKPKPKTDRTRTTDTWDIPGD